MRNPRRFLTGLITLVALTGLAPAVPAAARPATGNRFLNAATNLCLDTNGVDIYTHGCVGNPNQTWNLLGADFLQNSGPNICLDGDGSRVYALSCNYGAYQKWLLRRDGRIQHVLSGNCLDSDYAGRVYLLGCGDGNEHQHWYR